MHSHAESRGKQETYEVRLLDLPSLAPAGPAGGAAVITLEHGEAVTALKSVHLTRWEIVCVCPGHY